MAPKTFTMAEVRQHNTTEDLWVVIHDKVYDVTKFLLEHPGGDEVLIENAGKNATKDFDDADHSSSAIEQMVNFYKGDLVDDEKMESKKPQNATKKPASNYCLFGISAASLALGAIMLYKGYQYTKAKH